MRWRDKLTWSPSRAYGPFLLYREVETAEEASQTLVNAKFRGLTRSIGIDSGIAPTFSSKTLKPGTRVVENGFTKRTITLTGSDGLRYRLISYAKADDIRKIRLNATDRSEAYRTLSDEPVLEGDVPALTRPSHDDKFRKYPGFPSPPEKVIDKRTRKKSLSDSVEEPLRLLVKKPKWRQKSASPTDFPIFEPQLEYPCSQASLSLANGTSLVHRSADATSSLSQMRQTSTSVANATTDTVTTQSTFMTSTAPAPPPSIHMMRAPEHGVPSGHLHHPYYYAGPPPVQSEMHPAYPHPNFVAQQPQPVMYTLLI
ncbi:hypothetical protein BC830DRAFT_272412 [Chytriomyces sp. MP71]|nr:hypothetical protein BC830DRAFT_272412 [Chytriomyces sp. MP71]